MFDVHRDDDLGSIISNKHGEQDLNIIIFNRQKSESNLLCSNWQRD